MKPYSLRMPSRYSTSAMWEHTGWYLLISRWMPNSRVHLSSSSHLSKPRSHLEWSVHFFPCAHDWWSWANHPSDLRVESIRRSLCHVLRSHRKSFCEWMSDRGGRCGRTFLGRFRWRDWPNISSGRWTALTRPSMRSSLKLSTRLLSLRTVARDMLSLTWFPLLLMDIGFCEGECEISGSKCDQSEIKMQWKIVSNWLRAVLELSSSY